VIFALDTIVLSERMKAQPDRGIEDFPGRLPAENARVSAMTLAEIAPGVMNNPPPEEANC
jgi:predicted nucleic acid-binding protein